MKCQFSRLLFLASSLAASLLAVILLIAVTGNLSARAAGNSDPLPDNAHTDRQPDQSGPITFTAVYNDFFLGGGHIVKVVDLNGDGYPDLVRSGVYSDQTNIWFNDGTGNFYDSHQYLAGFQASDVGDLNGDLFPDLIGTLDRGVHPPTVTVFINNFAGYFIVQNPYTLLIDYFDPTFATKSDAIFLNAADDNHLEIAIWDFDDEHTVLFESDDSYGLYWGERLGSAWPKVDDRVDLNGDGFDDGWVSNGAGVPSEAWLNDGDGEVSQTASNLPAGHNLNAADYNGDTFLDLFIHDSTTGTIAFGNGTGTFTRSTQIFSATIMGHAASGDIDGDTDIDIVIPDSATGQINIWENQGSGQFSPTHSLESGPVTSLFLADLDLDDDLDIVATLQSGQTGVTVWLNDGDVSPPVNLQIELAEAEMGSQCLWHSASLAAGTNVSANWRFSDGANAVGQTTRHCYPSPGTYQAWVTTSNELGLLSTTVSIEVREPMTPVAQISVTGDLKLRETITVSIINNSGQIQSVHFGDGVSSWSPHPTYRHVYFQPGEYVISVPISLANNATQILTKTILISAPLVAANEDLALDGSFYSLSYYAHPADFDGNGTIDILQTSALGTGAMLWLNDGAGEFTYRQQFANTGYGGHTAIGDLNGDGTIDLISTRDPYFEGEGQILLNDGDGFFYSGQKEIFSATNSTLVRLADFDNDSDLDAFVAYSDTQSMDRIYWNDGTGIFTPNATVIGGDHSWDAAVVDLNGDDLPEIILARGDEPTQLWVNQGAGNFILHSMPLPNSYAVTVGDVNADLVTDIVLTSGAYYIVLTNRGNLNFEAQYTPNQIASTSNTEIGFGISFPGKMTLIDLNQDGHLDLLAAYSPYLVYQYNDGTGTFIFTGFEHSKHTTSIATADLDGDGDRDIVLGLNPTWNDWEEPHDLTGPVQPIWFVGEPIEPIFGITITGSISRTAGYQRIYASMETGNNISLMWDLGNGEQSTRLNPRVDYDSGTYTVTLTISNELSTATIQDTFVVAEEITPTAALAFTNTAPIRTPIAFELDIIDDDFGVIEWGDEAWSLAYRQERLLYHLYSEAGIYSVTVHSSQWDISTTYRITITDDALSGLNIVPDGPVTVNSPTVFTATVQSGQPTTYTWDMGDGTQLHGHIVSHTYTSFGIFTITLTATDGVTTLQATLPVGEPLRRIYLPALVVAPPPD